MRTLEMPVLFERFINWRSAAMERHNWSMTCGQKDFHACH